MTSQILLRWLLVCCAVDFEGFRQACELVVKACSQMGSQHEMRMVVQQAVAFMVCYAVLFNTVL
jgi:hypothetical protein